MSSTKKAEKRYLSSLKNRDQSVEAQWTPFRAAEKYYKTRFPLPDLSKVLDLALLDPNRIQEIQSGFWKGTANPDIYRDVSGSGPSHANIYTIPSVPGAGSSLDIQFALNLFL
jgi:alkylated DNA repair protein alkB homolog 1